MQPEFILLLLAPIFILCILIEYRISQRVYDIKDSLSSAVLGALHQVSDILAVIFLLPFFDFLHEYRVFEIKTNLASVIWAFLIQDFLYYWFHRASHNVHWLWAAHVVHHSSPKMNFSTAFRQSFMYPIAGMWVFWTPMALIGFQSDLIFAVVAINLAFQFFVHTQMVKKLGPLEFIFNTPSHHRVHHAINAEYVDRNYAGVLIIWDKVFGTFVEEKDNLDIKYGALEHPYTYNPIKATLHEWKVMFTKAINQPSILKQISVMFSYPRK